MAVTMTAAVSGQTSGKSGALSSALWPWLLLLPAFLSLASVSFYPIVNGVYLSFTNRSLITQALDQVQVEQPGGSHAGQHGGDQHPDRGQRQRRP